MKSPFPGMDAYLESRWLDLHPRLIVAAARQIQRQLNADLVASIETRVVVEDALGPTRQMGPDIHVVETPTTEHPSSHHAPGATAIAEPTVLIARSDPITQRHIEIIDASSGGRVITVIEFLSPSNILPGDGRRLYRQKQDDCLDAGVNLVEIDLTRAGERRLLCERWDGADRHRNTYQISAWRSAKPAQVELYALPLREPLPTIRIPLRPSDPDAILELQSTLDECYTDARYERLIDYAKPLSPALAGPEAAWAQNLLTGNAR